MSDNSSSKNEPLASVPQTGASSTTSNSSSKCECDSNRVMAAPVARAPVTGTPSTVVMVDDSTNSMEVGSSRVEASETIPQRLVSACDMSRRQNMVLTPEQRYKLAVIARIVSAYSAISNSESEDEDSFSDYDDEDEEDADFDDQLNDDTAVFNSLAHMLGVREKQLMSMFENIDNRVVRGVDGSKFSAIATCESYVPELPSTTELAEVQPETPTVLQTNKRKCWECRKKVPLTAITCRCGYTFCTSHRMAESHNCSFDYKASGKRKLERENPVVRPAKVAKIC